MVQPLSGEQPEQPSTQSSAGQPQSPYGTGGYQRQPARRRSGFAIAGIMLAIFVAVLGLISVIGLDKSTSLTGVGKALSIAGIVVSPPVGAAAGFAIAIGAGSVTVDPGCSTASSVGRQMATTLNADKAAISRDQTEPLAELADLQHLGADLQSLQSQLSTAEAQATHQSVKTGISAMIGDLNAFGSGLQAVENGDLSQLNQMTTAGDNLKSDSQALKTTCTSVLLGSNR